METVRFVFRCEELFDVGEQGESVTKEEECIRSLKEELLGAVIGLAKSCENADCTEQTTDLIIESLNAAAFNMEMDAEQIQELLNRVCQEKKLLVPGCEECASKCGNTDDYDMKKLWEGDADVSSVKCMILLGICGMAVDACQAKAAGHRDRELNDFFIKALSMVSYDTDLKQLLPVMIETGEMNFKCIELLDNVNNEKSTTSILLEGSHPSDNGNSRGLPFSIGFSWQETKTVCFFLTLLYLGNRPVYVGRKLPSFLTENVLNYVIEHYNVTVLDSDED